MQLCLKVLFFIIGNYETLIFAFLGPRAKKKEIADWWFWLIRR